MFYSPHGGDCCGATHVVGFREVNQTQLRTTIDDAIYEVQRFVDADIEHGEADRIYKGPFGHLIEVVLTDEQMIQWAQTLKGMGFRLGPRWLNDNSGNYCNLLTWQSKKPSKPRPFTW